MHKLSTPPPPLFPCASLRSPWQAFDKSGLRVDFSLSKPDSLDPSKSCISVSFSNTSAEVSSCCSTNRGGGGGAGGRQLFQYKQGRGAGEEAGDGDGGEGRGDLAWLEFFCNTSPEVTS